MKWSLEYLRSLKTTRLPFASREAAEAAAKEDLKDVKTDDGYDVKWEVLEEVMAVKYAKDGTGGVSSLEDVKIARHVFYTVEGLDFITVPFGGRI